MKITGTCEGITTTQLPSGYVPLPFTVRWRAALDHAMNEGGWHVHAAPPQYGKTTANRAHVRETLSAKRADGVTQKPVAQCVATDGKRLILRSLGEGLVDGGERFFRTPNPEIRVPGLCKALGVRLVIVNNSHNLDWHQYQELLTLDEVCQSRYGIRPAVVLSGVHEELSLKNLPKPAELIAQIENRIVCYEEIRGHDAPEVATALTLLLERDCPALVARGAAKHGQFLFELLTTKEFDRWGRKTVGARDLVEVVRRVVALYAEAPRTRLDKLIREAVQNYATMRQPAAPGPSTKAKAVAAGLASA